MVVLRGVQGSGGGWVHGGAHQQGGGGGPPNCANVNLYQAAPLPGPVGFGSHPKMIPFIILGGNNAFVILGGTNPSARTIIQ